MGKGATQTNNGGAVMQGLHAGWRRLNQILGLGVPDGFADVLTLLQHDRLQKLVPLLYLTIALNSFAGALAAQGDFPLVFQLIFPAIMIFASIVRYFMWKSRRGKTPTLFEARKQLRSTFYVALLLNVFGGYWTLAAYSATNEDVLATIFMIMSTFASITCLWSLPRAAMTAILVGLGPLLVVMLMSDDIGIVAMAMSVILVSILQILLIFGRFSEMVNNAILGTEMRRLAETDVLTGLANRRAFENELAEAVSTEAGLSLLMLDLDGFKPANDRFGHAAGDLILAKVADRLRSVCGGSSCVARIGGDEFAIIFRGFFEPSEISELARVIRTTLSIPYDIEGNSVVVSASIGISRYPADGCSPAELLRAADLELYSDKGKSRVRRNEFRAQRAA
jgi:diguanylate cyclase